MLSGNWPFCLGLNELMLLEAQLKKKISFGTGDGLALDWQHATALTNEDLMIRSYWGVVVFSWSCKLYYDYPLIIRLWLIP